MTRLHRSKAVPALVGVVAALLACVGGWVGGQIAEEASRADRPQDPVAAAYTSHEVLLDRGGIHLAGTVSIPLGPGPFPGVVLLSGAGPQDRDGTLGGHRRFLVLGDALTRAGIAVLRFDDRGTGGSQGDLLDARFRDLAGDALAAVAALRREAKVDRERVGLLGVSEGSLVATLAAVEMTTMEMTPEMKHPLAFLVLLSAPSLPGREIWIDQQLKVLRAGGTDEETLRRHEAILQEVLAIRDSREPLANRRQRLEAQVEALEELAGGRPLLDLGVRRRALVDVMLSPSMIDPLDHDPQPLLRRLDLPVLALYGGTDLQVSPEIHAPVLEAALRQAPTEDFMVEVFPGLNHLLQPSATGLPSEYGEIPVTLAPEILETVAGWILERTSETKDGGEGR